MSKSLTLSDLKEKGVYLSQTDAQEIHSRINEMAQGRHESGELFEVIKEESKQANSVQPSHGFTPVIDATISHEQAKEIETFISSSDNSYPIEIVSQPNITVKEPKPKGRPAKVK